MKSLLLVLLLATGAVHTAAHAAKVTTPATADHPPSFFAPLEDIPGVLPWSLLSKATTVKVKGGRMVPKYTEEITALDQTDVKVQGFMMPLQPGQKQKHFLLTVTSASCPFCLPAGPEGVVEINSKTPVKFTYAPMVMSGKMTVLKSDSMGLYYRINDASLVEP